MKYEIWLSNKYTHFGSGIAHLEDSSQEKLKCHLHTVICGTDNVLIYTQSQQSFAPYPLQWFTQKSVIEIHHWCKEIDAIALHNVSGTNLQIHGIGEIKDGESMEIKRDERYSSEEQ